MNLLCRIGWHDLTFDPEQYSALIPGIVPCARCHVRINTNGWYPSRWHNQTQYSQQQHIEHTLSDLDTHSRRSINAKYWSK